MITNDLFRTVLLKPAESGCNRLFITTGYATPAMVFHHMNELKKIGADVKIDLIIGMTAQDGLSKSSHGVFKQLVSEEFKGKFTCSYLVKKPPVHAKIYAWYKDDTPVTAFAGSANYTQTAFNSQRELMVECSSKDGRDYFNRLISETIYCDHQDAESCVAIYNDQIYKRLIIQKKLFEDKIIPPDFVLQGLPHKRISLLDNNGKLPERSGLNWGQRPEYGRDPDQAYIRLPSEVSKSDFFPDKGIHFTVYTDDEKVLICTRAQDQAKAIETPHNNSIIGWYFRKLFRKSFIKNGF